MPNDELQQEKENIMRLSHEMEKLEVGSGALEHGNRDSSPSRTTLRLAMINRSLDSTREERVLPNNDVNAQW